MLITSHSRYGSPRRGVILIVVLSMLTLFTILGISFVLLADAQASAARAAREAEGLSNRPDFEPEAALAFVLGQLLYPVSDVDGASATVGTNSSLRGHDLARSMYGYYPAGLNDKPFTGTGRVHDKNLPPQFFTPLDKPNYGTAVKVGPVAQDSAYLVNYKYFPSDGFIRDPERLGYRQYDQKTSMFVPPSASYVYTGGFNVPYTYPDHNNFFLGLIDPNNGAIVTPSFHREYLFGFLHDTVNNMNWLNFEGKYLTLRPRPFDHLRLSDVVNDPAAKSTGLDLIAKAPGNWPLDVNKLTPQQVAALQTVIANQQAAGRLIPYPTDRWGDVKNLDGAPGGCDSIWIDVGAPVMRAQDGRYYKMLAAPTMLQLDGRINLNAAGNLLGYKQTANQTHRSNQGWGAWEVNPAHVLDGDSPYVPPPGAAYPTEWRRIFLGYDEQPGPNASARVRGRWDNGTGIRKPLLTPITGSRSMRAWAQADFNGTRDVAAATPPPNVGDPSSKLEMPGTGNALAWMAFPNFPADSYNNGTGNANNVNEMTDHPQYYDTLNAPYYYDFDPKTGLGRQSINFNRRLPLSGMAQLLRFGGSGSEMLTSDVVRLLPKSLGLAGTTRRRNQVTLLSMDLDRPGAVPYVYDLSDPNTAYRMAAGGTQFPSGNPPIKFDIGNRTTIPTTPGDFDSATKTMAGIDYRTWRYQSPLGKALERLYLNRSLTPYPAIDTTTGLSSDPVKAANVDLERASFAMDVFNGLRAAVGADTPTNVAASTTNPAPFIQSQLRALRYLAQLAVNIVDYLDNDDVSTVLNWYTPAAVNGQPPPQPQYVVGFETPRLVINESYVQYDNDPTDLATNNNKATLYTVNTWVELMNPMLTDGNYNTADCTARLRTVKATVNNTVIPSYPIYQIKVVPDNPAAAPNAVATAILRSSNTTGEPPPPGAGIPAMRTYNGWAEGAAVLPLDSGRQYFDCAQGNNAGQAQSATPSGFCVVGPQQGKAQRYAKDPKLPVTFTAPSAGAGAYDSTDDMTYAMQVGAAQPVHPTIVLQRLANPTLPPQIDPFKAGYNPYVTTDFVERTPLPPDPNTKVVIEQFHDARQFDGAGPIKANPAIDARFSAWGRIQPYDGVNDVNGLRLMKEQPASGVQGQANNTFFRQNSTAATAAALLAVNAAYQKDPTSPQDPTLKQPFDWLVHVDRMMISPAELLHVSGVKSGNVTHRFITVGANGQVSNSHRAPWLDQTTRLHRFLEFVTAGPRGQGLGLGGRRPGLVNLNDVWTTETFLALADPEQQTPTTLPKPTWTPGANSFTRAEAIGVASTFIGQRSPGSDGTNTPAVGPTDPDLLAIAQAMYPQTSNYPAWALNRPFWPLSLGYNPNSDDLYGPSPPQPLAIARGIENTIYRTNQANTGMAFDVGLATPNTPARHPYQQKELLRKISNNVTTRGNVFAIWVTVGYFEVDPNNGFSLMAEFGKSENRQVRHRMFAVVDRTQMTVFSTGLVSDAAPGTYAVNKLLSPYKTPPANPDDPRTFRVWDASTPGTMLTFSPNTSNEETVMVDGAGNVTLTNTHYLATNGGRVISRGNPGPWSSGLAPQSPYGRYDPKKDADVVPYFALID
jgi:hypothetical protein